MLKSTENRESLATDATGDESLNIQDYLDASGDASRRTRSVHFILVIASVLVFAGLVNSLQHSWMLARIHVSNDPTAPYVVSKIGPAPVSPTPTELIAYQNRYREYYAALMKTYVDTHYIVRVPVFGFTVDANDLGMLGGIGFVVIMVVFRFCVSREVDNIVLSFKAAARLKKSLQFYHLLAMRQVFTVPDDGEIKRGAMLLWVPKAFCFAPLVVHLSVTGHDILTAVVGQQLSDLRTRVLFTCEGLVAAILIALTYQVVSRLRKLDKLWSQEWQTIKPQVVSPTLE
jgi:hypothetical protein